MCNRCGVCLERMGGLVNQEKSLSQNAKGLNRFRKIKVWWIKNTREYFKEILEEKDNLFRRNISIYNKAIYLINCKNLG